MHCLVETDLGWVSDPAVVPMQPAQALLRLPDRRPDRDSYTAVCRSTAGRSGLSLDLPGGRLSLSATPADAPPLTWRESVLARLGHAACDEGFIP